MDFVIALCDVPHGQFCPDLAGQYVTAAWPLPDPAQFNGSATERTTLLNELYAMIRRRIEIFTSLPFPSLDRMALKARLDEIGDTTKRFALTGMNDESWHQWHGSYWPAGLAIRDSAASIGPRTIRVPATGWISFTSMRSRAAIEATAHLLEFDRFTVGGTRRLAVEDGKAITIANQRHRLHGRQLRPARSLGRSRVRYRSRMHR